MCCLKQKREGESKLEMLCVHTQSSLDFIRELPMFWWVLYGGSGSVAGAAAAIAFLEEKKKKKKLWKSTESSYSCPSAHLSRKKQEGASNEHPLSLSTAPQASGCCPQWQPSPAHYPEGSGAPASHTAMGPCPWDHGCPPQAD